MDEKHYLGIDIGGTYIKYGVVDKTGTILNTDAVETYKEKEALLAAIEKIIEKNNPETLYGVGISTPGKIDIEKGIIRHGGSLTFLNGLALEKHINDKFNLPCALINDGKAAAMAEQWVGKFADVTNGMVITLGTGLGGGMILNNALYSGSNFQAGEISWMFHNMEDINESGMMSTDLSAVSFVQQCAEKLNLPDKNDGKTVFEQIKAGENEELTSYFTAYSRRMAWLILNLQSILDLEKFLIGGGVSRQEILIDEINKQYEDLRSQFPYFVEHFEGVKIEACKYHNDSNILGAVYQLLVKLDSA